MADNEFERFLKNEFIKCLKQSMNESVADANWDYRENRELKHESYPKIILLTVSSHLFRIVLILHFSYNETCHKFVAAGLKSGGEKLGKDKIHDYLKEVGNSLCGGFKRNLGNVVPSLGMSTPNILDDYCLSYIEELDVIDKHTATVSFNGQELFGASYYLCAAEKIQVDMSNARLSEETQSEAGELEFF
ncbi:hypothetical protein [Pleionea sediminis]|uniref:hypothetical protein n=1 Tax=Pleionea sediminis TaxID=2569479 RepID=UPI0011868710|nr:hypothetical protein [Pleionea sediminis]